MLGRYRAVFAVPGCARLLFSALAGRLPQGMASLAMLLLVRSHTGSYAAAGTAVGLYALAGAAGAPAQGRLIDRYGRRRVLAPAALLEALTLTTLVIAADAGLGAVALVALAALAGPPMPSIGASLRSLLREVVVDPGVRETAYALDSVIQELIFMAGPLVVAAVIAFASPAAALILAAAVSVLGTALFVSSPLMAGAGRGAVPRAGGRALQIPALRALLGPIALMGAGLGSVEVGLPSLALHAGSRPASGVMLALWSLGSLTGGLVMGARAWQAPLAVRYRALLLAAVLCTAPLIAARTIAEGIGGSFLAGLTIAPVFSCQYALLGRAVTPGSETEAFTWAFSALVAGVAGGSALSGALIGGVGVSAPFVVACAAAALAAASAVRVGSAVDGPAAGRRHAVRS
jgi:MFS family permease